MPASTRLRPELLLVALPAALGYAASAACPMPPSDDIPFRPPAWVFGVVWPALYLLLGVAWCRTALAFGASSLRSAPYLATSAALAAWLAVYGCLRQTRNAVFVLLAAVLSVAFALATSRPAERLMLIPLLVWCSFATLMNAWQTAADPRARDPRARDPRARDPDPRTPRAPSGKN